MKAVATALAVLALIGCDNADLTEPEPNYVAIAGAITLNGEPLRDTYVVGMSYRTSVCEGAYDSGKTVLTSATGTYALRIESMSVPVGDSVCIRLSTRPPGSDTAMWKVMRAVARAPQDTQYTRFDWTVP